MGNGWGAAVGSVAGSRRIPGRGAIGVLLLAALAFGCGDDDATSDGDVDLGSADLGGADLGPPGDWACDGEWRPDLVALEEAVVVELNARRAEGGTCGATSLPSSDPLVVDASLQVAARCHALDQLEQDRPSSLGSDGSTFIDRAERAGYEGMPVASLAAASRVDVTVAEIVDLLLSDEPSCERFLGSTATDVGFGAARPSLGYDTSWTYYFELVVGR